MNDRDLGPRRVRPNHREQPNDNNNRREPSEASVRLQHRNNQANEEKFGKLKFQMPKFKGEEDPNAYIDWELKVEKIFRIHNYSEEKKVAMASLEFEDYASVWWEDIQANIERFQQTPIDTWEYMKEVMYTRFVPEHYRQDLFNKLQTLKQYNKTVEEYYKEMEMLLRRGDVHELEEQTIARFLNGLSPNIKKIVDFQPYKNLVELLHQATKAERHVKGEEQKTERTRAYFTSRNASAAASNKPTLPNA